MPQNLSIKLFNLIFFLFHNRLRFPKFLGTDHIHGWKFLPKGDQTSAAFGSTTSKHIALNRVATVPGVQSNLSYIKYQTECNKTIELTLKLYCNQGTTVRNEDRYSTKGSFVINNHGDLNTLIVKIQRQVTHIITRADYMTVNAFLLM